MTETPAMIRPSTTLAQEEVLRQYAAYHYGDGRIRHSPERLREFSATARQFGLLTMADYFELLAERSELLDEQQELQAMAEHEAHREYLRNDYR